MRILKGIVVSDKMSKTVVVRVDGLKKHPKYQKYYRASKKLKAHADGAGYGIGDTVVIQETRPISKDKRWRAVQAVKKAAGDNEEINQTV
jgi:small subunit ribosomal protein S17